MMEKIKTLIIDDEKNGREILQSLIEQNFSDLEIIGTASSAKMGVEIIMQGKPDLIFLDVEMPNGSGFDMLKNPLLSDLTFHIIFTTAYEQYAIEAIRVAAVDYLLKPIDLEELKRAIDRSKSRNKETGPTISEISRIIKRNLQNNSKIKLVTREGFELLPTSSLVYCKSEGNYTRFILDDGSFRLVSKTLKIYQESLELNGFLRIHKSHIINLDKIVGYLNQKQGAVRMTNGDILKVSKDKKELLINSLS